MEQMTYSKLNLKKSRGHPSKTCSAKEDAPTILYADIRTGAIQGNLPAPVPEVWEKTLTSCSYKTVSRVLILIIVLLCCALGYMVFHLLELKAQCSNSSDNSTVTTDVTTTVFRELCFNCSKTGCRLCPPNWLLHGDHCYYYSDVTGGTWNQSRDYCKKMRADLLVIKNQEQQEFIQRTLRQQTDDTYWIGLQRDGDGWRWVDGEHYNSSLIQIKTQSAEQCVVMARSTYYQRSCNSANRWTCLKEAVRIGACYDM